jgi:hypothetical protein
LDCIIFHKKITQHGVEIKINSIFYQNNSLFSPFFFIQKWFNVQNIACMKKLTKCKKVNLAHNKQERSDQHTKHMQQKKLKK